MTDARLQPTAHPKQKPDYRLEELDGELLLYHLEQSRIMYCNQTASLIWQLCSGEQTIEQIVSMLAEAFPDDATQIETDVLEVLNQFLQAGCINMV